MAAQHSILRRCNPPNYGIEATLFLCAADQFKGVSGDDPLLIGGNDPNGYRALSGADARSVNRV